MKKISKLILVLMILLSGCSSGTGTPGDRSGIDETIQELNDLNISTLAVIPLASDSNKSSSYMLPINNYGDESYFIKSITLGGTKYNGSLAINSVLTVDAKECESIGFNGCNIKLMPHVTQSTDILLSITLEDKSGNTTNLSQVIRMSDSLHNPLGLALFNDINQVIAKDNQYSVAIPVLLEDNFDDIKVINGSLLCEQPGFKKGNSCTYLLNGQVVADNTLITTGLTGFRGSQEVLKVPNNILIRTKSSANLLLSHGKSINSQGGITQFTIYNSGNASTSAKVVLNDENLSIIDNDSCLSKAIAPQAFCQIGISSKAKLNSHQGVVFVNSANQNLSFNYKPHSKVSFTMSMNSNLLNGIPNSTTIQKFTLTNNSAEAIRDVSFELMANGDNHLNNLELESYIGSNSCSSISGFELGAGKSCSLNIKHSPQINQSGSIIIKATGKTDTQELSSYFGVDYSGVDATNRISISRLKDLNLATTGKAEEAIFTVTNTYPELPLSIKDIAFRAGTPFGEDLTLDSGTCTSGTTLSKDSPDCTGKVKLNSTSQSLPKYSSMLSFTYYITGVENSDVTIYSNSFLVNSGHVTPNPGPIPTPGPTPNPGPIHPEGVHIETSIEYQVEDKKVDLNSSTAWIYIDPKKTSNKLTVKYKFTNTGLSSAKSFKTNLADAIKNLDPETILAPGVDGYLSPFLKAGKGTIRNITDHCNNIELSAMNGSCDVTIAFDYTLKDDLFWGGVDGIPSFMSEPVEVGTKVNYDGEEIQVDQNKLIFYTSPFASISHSPIELLENPEFQINNNSINNSKVKLKVKLSSILQGAPLDMLPSSATMRVVTYLTVNNGPTNLLVLSDVVTCNTNNLGDCKLNIEDSFLGLTCSEDNVLRINDFILQISSGNEFNDKSYYTVFVPALELNHNHEICTSILSNMYPRTL